MLKYSGRDEVFLGGLVRLQNVDVPDAYWILMKDENIPHDLYVSTI